MLLSAQFVVAAGALPGPARAETSSGSSTTVTKTVSRVHLVDGQDSTVDTRKVSLSLSQTTNLRSQRISVWWKGAHPTGGVFSDQNAPAARNQEYPFVLLECRGVGAAVTPSTCWTQSPIERKVETRNRNALFPPYRVDRYATAADRKDVVNQPTHCSNDAPVQHWTPFIAADRTTYEGGTSGCGTAPPEATALTTLDRPGNTTYGVTRTDGTGSVLFSIWTDEDNASIGCSSAVRCSLVAVPIEGISCDVEGAGLPAADRPAAGDEAKAAQAACGASGRFKPGALSASGNDGLVDQAVTGALWWSASNWRNKIAVPLTFAETARVCDVVSSLPQADVYGSELLTQATSQWAPSLCTGGGTLKLKHVQTGEPQARNLVVSGGIHAAFVANPPAGGYSTPTVSAPTAVTGFAVGYVLDDAQGGDYHALRLNARLLAKLMTESYPTLPQIKSGAYYLSQNPLTMLQDPEFLALNPALKGTSTDRSPTSATIILPSSDSDVMWALTSYIDADPEASSWLDGNPDPWGMVVNRHYQARRTGSPVSLPTYSWPLLDTYEPKDYYDASGGDLNPCLHNNPVPYLPLVASPVVRLSVITQNLQLALPSSQTGCQPGLAEPDPTGEKLISPGRQPQGYRFLLGITPLADAERYRLDTAALETRQVSAGSEKFSTSTGRTFVAPSNVSLRAAANRAVPDEKAGVWTIPYPALRAGAPSAYPGTMIVSTAVPTSGLSRTDAASYAALLRFVAGKGQTPGLANGNLPPGYLPLTDANGLAALRAHTLAAAAAVAAQKGSVPALVPGAPERPTADPTSSTGSTPGQGREMLPGIGTASPGSSATRLSPVVAGPPGAQFAGSQRTSGLGAGAAGLVLPLIALAGLGGLAAAASSSFGRRRTRT